MGSRNLEVVHWKVSYPDLRTSLKEKYSLVIDRDNTSSFHQATVDPGHLCGPQVIQTMTKTPQNLFLNKYYYLYYTVLLCVDLVCRLCLYR